MLLYLIDTALLNLSINIAERYFDVVAAPIENRSCPRTNTTCRGTSYDNKTSTSTFGSLHFGYTSAAPTTCRIQSQLPRAEYGKAVSERSCILLGLSQDTDISVSNVLITPTIRSSEDFRNKRMNRPWMFKQQNYEWRVQRRPSTVQ